MIRPLPFCKAITNPDISLTYKKYSTFLLPGQLSSFPTWPQNLTQPSLKVNVCDCTLWRKFWTRTLWNLMNGSHGQHTMPFASIIEAPDAVDISSPSILFLWSFHWHDKLSYACTWEVCEPSVWCYWSWCHSSWSLKNVPLFLNVPSLTCKIDLYRAIFHILYSLWLLVDNRNIIFMVSLFI